MTHTRQHPQPRPPPSNVFASKVNEILTFVARKSLSCELKRLGLESNLHVSARYSDEMFALFD
uniref:Uncharacterized protein n=1 Tax=Physcomitrium patens TaxID=3218 RepID=A0A2K1JHU5_PHYPA|nr:hypothetical protein PHYPA_018492 [Physcomitrium patens]